MSTQCLRSLRTSAGAFGARRPPRTSTHVVPAASRGNLHRPCPASVPQQVVGPCTSQQSWQRQPCCVCRAAPEAADPPAVVAVEGDIVTLHFTCKGPEGEVLETTKSSEPITFEIGAGEVMGNALFQAFDGAIRGLPVGAETIIEAQGGEWKKELLFQVPRDHQEIERLEGRYKNQGGLSQGMVVELANGGMALVVAMDDEAVTLDANNMMAGKTLTFELEVVGIDRQQ